MELFALPFDSDCFVGLETEQEVKGVHEPEPSCCWLRHGVVLLAVGNVTWLLLDSANCHSALLAKCTNSLRSV